MPVGPESREKGLRHVECPDDVEPEHRFPVRGVAVRNRVDADRGTGNIEQCVDGSLFLDDTLGEIVHRVSVRNVQ